jgi:hypothetical protein
VNLADELRAKMQHTLQNPSPQAQEDAAALEQHVGDHDRRIMEYAAREEREVLFANFSHGVLQWAVWLQRSLKDPSKAPRNFKTKAEAIEAMIRLVESIETPEVADASKD